MSTLKTRPKDAKFPKHSACTTIHPISPSAIQDSDEQSQPSKIHQQKKLKRARQKSKIFLLSTSPSLSPSKTSPPGQPRNRKPNRSPTASNNLTRTPPLTPIQNFADRQAGHLRHGAGGAAPHLRPPPSTPLPQGQARRRARRSGLTLGTPGVLVLTPGARLLGSAPRRRAIPGRGSAAALLRTVLAGRCATARAEAVRPRCIYLALSCALW